VAVPGGPWPDSRRRPALRPPTQASSAGQWPNGGWQQ
jgi:hypothetical protein